MTIDVHAHAFPDDLAGKAIEVLNSEIPESAHAVLDGSIADLLRSMDRAGIEAAVICNIATKPKQVDAIIRWSRTVDSERIIPLGSVHPAGDNPAGDVHKVAEAGLKGIKLHAMYQDFAVDAPAMLPIYEAICERGLVLTLHAGRDIAYPPDDDRASPERIRRVHDAFPDMPIVAAHMGGWKMWGQVARKLAGTDVYLETSYSFGMGCEGELDRIMERHCAERILFGTDSPWVDQALTLERVEAAFPDAVFRRKVLHENAVKLYGLDL